MRSHRAQVFAALFALVTTTAAAQYTTPSLPSDNRCSGLTGAALDSCAERTSVRGDAGPSLPAAPRYIAEPAPGGRVKPIPAAPDTPRNIVEAMPDKAPTP
jgi:hypothetical protein